MSDPLFGPEEFGPDVAPSEELLPTLVEGMWVRFVTSSVAPKRYRGRDGVIIRAPSVRMEADEISPVPYSKQSADTIFVVRCRDDGTEVEAKRSAFDWVGTKPPTGVLA